MMLALVNWIVDHLYDLRMETVWQAYGARVINYGAVKVNRSIHLFHNHNLARTGNCHKVSPEFDTMDHEFIYGRLL